MKVANLVNAPDVTLIVKAEEHSAWHVNFLSEGGFPPGTRYIDAPSNSIKRCINLAGDGHPVVGRIARPRLRRRWLGSLSLSRSLLASKLSLLAPVYIAIQSQCIGHLGNDPTM